MVCPKCGKTINGAICANCGFSFLKEPVVAVGINKNVLQALQVELKKANESKYDIANMSLQEIEALDIMNLSEADFHKVEEKIREYRASQAAKQLSDRPAENETTKSSAVQSENTDNNKDGDEDAQDAGGTPPAGKKIGTRILCVIVLVALSGLIGLYIGMSDPKVGAGWGDSDGGRPSYTIDEINEGVLGDTITFNSISDGEIGDEKNFVAAKIEGKDVSEWNANSIKVKDGEKYTVRMYVHNNNPNGNNAEAKDVKAQFVLPEGLSKEQMIYGYLDSSNATPSTYWDGVTLKSDKQFFIEYVEGSARFNNNALDEKELDDEIVSSGTYLGYKALDGIMPGCYEYSGVATIDVVVHEETWGPEDRATFTMKSTAPEPTFNSITDNPDIGDERNFVRIGEINPDATDLTDSVELKKGKQYLVYIYIHNNASSTFNDKEHDYKGVATKTRLATTFPKTVATGESGIVKAKITSENSNPLCVWDTALVTTKEESISLKYVSGSAKIYNDWETNESILPSSLFNPGGTLVGLNKLNGVVPGCEEYHSVVSYVLEAE